MDDEAPLALRRRSLMAWSFIILGFASMILRWGKIDVSDALPLSTPELPVDVAGRLFLLPNFLAEDEVLAFRSIAEINPSRFETKPPLHYAYAELPAHHESSANELTRAVEERIANVTGIPAHVGDSRLQMAVTRPWSEALGHIFNLHHDTNKAPRRAATVLIYLSDASSDRLEGGETIFPCLELDENHPMASDLCKRLGTAFAAGERFLRATSATHDGNPAFDTEAAEAASEECLRMPYSHDSKDDIGGTGVATKHMSPGDQAMAARGRTGGLHIRPLRGAALLFFSRRDDEEAHLIPEMWHGGCRVRQGEKWTLQLFKELPAHVDDDGAGDTIAVRSAGGDATRNGRELRISRQTEELRNL